MNIAIEKNIPIPPIATGRKKTNRREKYPLSKLKVGDSFFIKGMKVTSLAPTVTTRAKKMNIKVTMRSLEDGVRVWRTA